MAKLYSFDVDETLWCSNGPITRQMLEDLKKQGHVIGLCGNWARFVQSVSDWHELISFFKCSPPEHGPDGNDYVSKGSYLSELRKYVPCEEIVHVGNDSGRVNSLGFVCLSKDKEEAEAVGIRFILEDDFANGVR